MGGMTSILLDNLSAEIWSWCSERDIFLTAQYIPGNENCNADHIFSKDVSPLNVA
jgi:hypothetical protein